MVGLIVFLLLTISAESIELNRSPDDEGYSYTSYQPRIECTAAFPPIHPTTIHDLQDIVIFALNNNVTVKAVGNLHSVTDCICTDGILVVMKNFKSMSFDPRSNLITAGVGLDLQDVLDYAHQHGRDFTGSPTFGGITVGGAVGIGSHGANLKEPASISDQLVSISFVDGLGNIKVITEDDEDFKAFRVHLGLLGIIFELVLRTTDATEQYKLQISNYPIGDEVLWKVGEIMKMAGSSDFLQFFWFPTNKQVVMSVGTQVRVNTSGSCEVQLIPDVPFLNSVGVSTVLELMQKTEDQVGYFIMQSYAKLSVYQEVPGRVPYFTKEDGSTSSLPTAVGYGNRMVTSRCKECAWEHGHFSLLDESATFVIDVEELPKAISSLREIFASILVGFPLIGMYFRFLKESDSYLGLSSGRRSVEIEMVSKPRFDRTQPKLGIAATQAFEQALVGRHGGRPHWTKNGLYYTTPTILYRAFPNISNFIDVMNRMDPCEVFMNDFGRRIKYKRDEMTLSKAAKKLCALDEACLCQNDSDCGDESPTALVCSFMEFRVCRKRPTELNKMREKVERELINKLTALTDSIDYVMKKLAIYIPGLVN